MLPMGKTAPNPPFIKIAKRENVILTEAMASSKIQLSYSYCMLSFTDAHTEPLSFLLVF